MRAQSLDLTTNRLRQLEPCLLALTGILPPAHFASPTCSSVHCCERLAAGKGAAGTAVLMCQTESPFTEAPVTDGRRSAEAVTTSELAKRRERDFAAGQRPACAPHPELSARNALQENMVMMCNYFYSIVIALARHGIMAGYALS